MDYRQQLYQTRLEDYARWFKDHKALVVEHRGSPVRLITEIIWAKPQDSNCAIIFLLRGGTLFVTGDLGSATYRWSQVINPTFVAGCDWHYFIGKLETLSRSGHQAGSDWDPEAVAYYMNLDLNDWAKEKYESEDPPQDEVGKVKWEDLTADDRAARVNLLVEANDISRWQDNTSREDEWARYIWDNDKHFGVDDLSGPAGWGKVPSLRALSHWYAFKAAWKQWQERDLATKQPPVAGS